MNCEICRIILFFLFTLFGCSQVCELRNVDFNSSFSSPVEVESTFRDGDCKLPIEIYLPNDYPTHIGHLLLENDIFYTEVNNQRNILFDFSADLGAEYPFQLNSDMNCKVQLEGRYAFNNQEIFKFRMVDSFFIYEEYMFDTVFFVSKDQFILGYYFSTFEFDSDIEVVVSPQGEILENLIDYSKKKFRRLL
jgi:hypothetical protein